MSEGLAQGPYVAARVGFEPMTLRTKGDESTNEPPRPTVYHHHIHNQSSSILPCHIIIHHQMSTLITCIINHYAGMIDDHGAAEVDRQSLITMEISKQ